MSEYIDTTTKVPEDATEFDYELFERFMSGGPWVAHSEYMKLRAENVKLREEIEAAKHDLQVFSMGSVQLEAENAKLWELVDELYPLADYGAMDASELDRAHDLMRELGEDE